MAKTAPLEKMKLEELIETIEADPDHYIHYLAVIIEPDGNITEVRMGHVNTLTAIAKHNGTYYESPIHELFYAHLLNMTNAIAVDYECQLYHNKPNKIQMHILNTLNDKQFIDLKLQKLNY